MKQKLKQFSFPSTKSLLLLICLLFFGSPMLRAQGNATLVLWHADGSKTDIELYTLPQVSFSGDLVLITSDVLSMEYPKQDVLRFTFKGKGTDIKAPQAEADYSVGDGQITFHGITAADRVAVYKTNGIRVPARFAVNGTDISLSLSSIPAGVYILSVNGKTSKFTRP